MLKPRHNKKLIVKVLVIGCIIAILSYLFHPDVGPFNVTINGEPVAEPLIHFAAIPTFLALIGITGLLMMLLFLGFGVLLFLFALLLAITATVIIAPYFWPILAIIILIIVLTSFNSGDEKSY